MTQARLGLANGHVQNNMPCKTRSILHDFQLVVRGQGEPGSQWPSVQTGITGAKGDQSKVDGLTAIFCIDIMGLYKAMPPLTYFMSWFLTNLPIRLAAVQLCLLMQFEPTLKAGCIRANAASFQNRLEHSLLSDWQGRTVVRCQYPYAEFEPGNRCLVR